MSAIKRTFNLKLNRANKNLLIKKDVVMKIYDFEGFPNPARIRIALAEKGVQDVEFVPIDVPNGEHRQAKFLANNPGGAVPLLELQDGTTISECTAITEYIDGTYEGINLTGETPKQRAIVHMMQRRAESGVLDAIAAFFHHATAGLGPDIETDQCPEWGNKQKTHAIDGMRYFDTVLAVNKYVAGHALSMADITLYAGLGYADFAAVDIPKTASSLRAWRDRMAARPSIAS